MKYTIIRTPREAESPTWGPGPFYYFSAGYRGRSIGPLRSKITEAFADATRYNADRDMLALLRTVRLWARINGAWVRLTLPPGYTRVQHVSWSDLDGEGSCTTVETWERIDHATISYKCGSDGRDCDGGFRDFSEAHVAIADIPPGMPAEYHPDHHQPYIQWKPIDQETRDLAAEAAGY